MRRYDARCHRLRLFCLAAAMTMFSEAGTMNHRIQYVRRTETLPIMRDYMYRAEAQLRAMAG